MKFNNGVVKITGSSIDFIDGALTTEDNRLYKIANSDRLPLDKKTPIIINGIEEGDNYSINYSRGEIRFQTTKERLNISIDGAYLTTSTFGHIEGANYDTKRNAIDITNWDDKDERFAYGKESATITIDAFYVWDEALLEYFNGSEQYLIELDLEGHSISLLGFFDQDTLSASGDDATKRNLKFIGSRE